MVAGYYDLLNVTAPRMLSVWFQPTEGTEVITKRELIHTALQALIRKHTKKDLTDLAGKIQLQDDFDHKKLRELSRDAG